jgi:hypothetical protein
LLNAIGVNKAGTIYVSNTRRPECVYKITATGDVSTFVEGKPLVQRKERRNRSAESFAPWIEDKLQDKLIGVSTQLRIARPHIRILSVSSRAARRHSTGLSTSR